jgi:hypothetical protein
MQTVARAGLSAPHRSTIAAKASAADAAQRAARRCAPGVVLFVTMAVVAIFRDDVKIATEPPLPVEPLSKKEVTRGPVTLPVISLPTAPPAPVSKANAVDRPARPSHQAPIAEPPPAKTSEFLGSLSITSVPQGAKVFINGKPVGVTPLALTDRRAGSLALQITREGFERWSAAIQVPAGRSTRVTATLQPSAP